MSGKIYILNRIAGKDKDRTPGSYFSCGIHPWFLNELDNQKEILQQQVGDPLCVAIGEAGLDKNATTCLTFQKDIFHFQAVLAERYNKPLIIHCVKAWQEILEVYKEIKPHVPWIIHGFRGSKELAAQLLSHGFYLSFGKYFNPETIHMIPADRLLLETDDKDIPIETVYQGLIDELQADPSSFISQIRENVRNIFSI
ncbi:MAG: TatD family hydrolase [Tannerellaceae bacterium]|nr:TatD family hydrolase [Tannerellaceae bacterium]